MVNIMVLSEKMWARTAPARPVIAKIIVYECKFIYYSISNATHDARIILLGYLIKAILA